MTRIQNDKMLNNVINSVTAAVDQEKTVGGRFSRRRYGTVTKRQDIKEETAMKRSYAVYQVDAFTKEKLSGNPAGVVSQPITMEMFI